MKLDREIIKRARQLAENPEYIFKRKAWYYKALGSVQEQQRNRARARAKGGALVLRRAKR